MRPLKCVLILFSFIGLMIVGCSDQSQSPVDSSDQASLQKVSTREFSGSNNPTGTINPAIWKYPDGKILFYKYVGETEYAVNFTDGDPDILSGAGVVEINGITDLNTMTGHWYGKFKLIPTNNAGGGTWQSVYHGTSTFTNDAYNGGPGWILLLIQNGHGEGGSINGMQWQYVVTVHADPGFTTYYTEVEGSVTSH